jgi:hypothetical protein
MRAEKTERTVFNEILPFRSTQSGYLIDILRKPKIVNDIHNLGLGADAPPNIMEVHTAVGANTIKPHRKAAFY